VSSAKDIMEALTESNAAFWARTEFGPSGWAKRHDGQCVVGAGEITLGVGETWEEAFKQLEAKKTG